VSSSKTFDLGLLRKNESRSILFDRRGEVEIQCAIHPEMLLVVDVQ
jgi:plastocyanin